MRCCSAATPAAAAPLVAIVAAVPSIVADLGVSARPVRVEALLLTVIVFLGVNVAWLLLFDETPSRAVA